MPAAFKNLDRFKFRQDRIMYGTMFYLDSLPLQNICVSSLALDKISSCTLSVCNSISHSTVETFYRQGPAWTRRPGADCSIFNGQQCSGKSILWHRERRAPFIPASPGIQHRLAAPRMATINHAHEQIDLIKEIIR